MKTRFEKDFMRRISGEYVYNKGIYNVKHLKSCDALNIEK